MNDHLPQAQQGSVNWRTLSLVVALFTALVGASAGVLVTMAQWSHDLVASIDTELRDFHGRVVANEIHRISHGREAAIYIEHIKENTASVKHLDKRLDEVQQRLGTLSTMSQARNSLLSSREISELLNRVRTIEQRLEQE